MTLDVLASAYPWTKAFHLIAVIAWMAGLFYLPRLFVYHHQVAVGGAESELFKVMERRLLRAIMNPAMVAGLPTRDLARSENTSPVTRQPAYSSSNNSRSAARAGVASNGSASRAA